MQQLNHERCIPCEGGVPTATDSEIAGYLLQLPDWVIVESEHVKRLIKAFTFDNFAHALAFTNQIGALAEEEGHHPALLTEWGRVTVTWWTHAIGGLHKNDFIMAARTEEIARTAVGIA
jgi:4a-hydroxytetrahydrobiopterin dehydratase